MTQMWIPCWLPFSSPWAVCRRGMTAWREGCQRKYPGWSILVKTAFPPQVLWDCLSVRVLALSGSWAPGKVFSAEGENRHKEGGWATGCWEQREGAPRAQRWVLHCKYLWARAEPQLKAARVEISISHIPGFLYCYSKYCTKFTQVVLNFVMGFCSLKSRLLSGGGSESKPNSRCLAMSLSSHGGEWGPQTHLDVPEGSYGRVEQRF